jgi:gas vesicle protein
MAENQGSGGGSDKLVYFLIGAGIGAITALLFAPKTGSELRAEIADATRKGIDQARDTGREISERASEAYQTGVERAGELYQTGVERASEVAARSKEAVSGIGERSKEALQRQKSSLAAAIEAGKQGYREAKQADQAKAAFEES